MAKEAIYSLFLFNDNGGAQKITAGDQFMAILAFYLKRPKNAAKPPLLAASASLNGSNDCFVVVVVVVLHLLVFYPLFL
jgi:hypothetical protein